MKTICIYHRADFDGLFSGAVVKHFVPDAELIGWDFGDMPVAWDSHPDDKVYVVDLPPSACIDFAAKNLVWIDHHRSSIEEFRAYKIEGYRVDGVAACRLCWQWFQFFKPPVRLAEGAVPLGTPTTEDYKDRKVEEPLCITLAGEYDVWDKRDPRAEQFQFGLTADNYGLNRCAFLLECNEKAIEDLCIEGRAAMRWQAAFAAGVEKERSYTRKWEGVEFCILGSAHARNSMWFPAGGFPAEALMCWRYDGERVTFSLYHAPGHEDIDLSVIAAKYGGGGHKGACGFSMSLDDALTIIR